MPPVKRPGGGKPGGTVPRGAQDGGTRTPAQRVRTAKHRTHSSTLWLHRQLNDPYVAEAKRLGYRSRAAFKLLQLDERYHLIRRGSRIVDLGSAPGGWCQVAAALAGTTTPGASGKVVGIDILAMEPVAGATTLELDFLSPDAPARLKQLLAGEADLVLSDMAAPATGHAPTDHLRIMGLAEIAYEFAAEVLTQGGTFIAKVLKGGTEGELLKRLKKDFTLVRHAKPPASRADSAEVYVIASGFRGGKRDLE